MALIVKKYYLVSTSIFILNTSTSFYFLHEVLHILRKIIVSVFIHSHGTFYLVKMTILFILHMMYLSF